jgi:hypothetical protein
MEVDGIYEEVNRVRMEVDGIYEEVNRIRVEENRISEEGGAIYESAESGRMEARVLGESVFMRCLERRRTGSDGPAANVADCVPPFPADASCFPPRSAERDLAGGGAVLGVL